MRREDWLAERAESSAADVTCRPQRSQLFGVAVCGLSPVTVTDQRGGCCSLLHMPPRAAKTTTGMEP